MANITPTQLTSDGTAALTLVAATGGGDTVINATAGSSSSSGSSISGTVLVVNNGSGSPITVTLTGLTACNFGVTHNATYTVAAGKQQHIPIPGAFINTSGQVAVGYSAVVTVTVGAYKH